MASNRNPSVQQIGQYLGLVTTVRTLVDGVKQPDDWRLIYDMVFSDNISAVISSMGMAPEYADPDMDYEDDVKAYLGALEEDAKKYKRMLELGQAHIERPLSSILSDMLHHSKTHPDHGHDCACKDKYVTEVRRIVPYELWQEFSLIASRILRNPPSRPLPPSDDKHPEA